MAVHTEVPRGDLDAFLRDYGLPPADAVIGIAAGVENTNYFVDTGGRALVLTLYEGRTALGDLPYFLALTGHAAARGVPMPAPVLRADVADRVTVGQPLVLTIDASALEAFTNRTDLALVIEVADSSIRRDEKVKLGIYARAGVPEFWIANVQREQITVYTQPDATGGKYGREVTYAATHDFDHALLGAVVVEEVFR